VNKILYISRSIPPIWLAAFLYFAMKGNSDAPPPNLPLFALVAVGTIYHLVYSQALVRRLASFCVVFSEWDAEHKRRRLEPSTVGPSGLRRPA
jgi:hypothetical protein